jgi:decaprenylphospho-beta-D-erythro-pentofuranosid-2-ulose 2-reductase
MPESPISPATPLSPRRRAILVGASSGIGAALAKQLARQGFTLALLARREELLRSLCDDINRECGETRAVAYVHDVTDYASVPALLQRILVDLGGLDLFIYNSGVSLPPGPGRFDFDKDRQMAEVNFVGALAWLDPVAALFEGMQAGQIVGISSVAGERGRVGNPAYNASKAALTCHLEGLRNRLTRRGVNVLTVIPGFVKTEMLKTATRTTGAISAERAAATISAAIRARKQTVYVPGIWALIMFVIRNIPSIVFRRLTI